MAEFAEQGTSEFNQQYFSDVYGTQGNIVTDLVGGAVASVVDVGASLWNSLPFIPDVETRDLLSNISDNALRVYEQHPDAVHAASFIGGMFVPLGLVTKGMSLARAGVKGADWFSDAGRTKSLTRIDELFKSAGPTSKEYKQALLQLHTRTAGNQLLDVAAGEIALLGMMGEHPYLEDYMKDPVTNFGLSLLIGGGIGVGLGRIVDNAALRKQEGSAFEGVMRTIMGDKTDEVAAKKLFPGMTGGAAMATMEFNIMRWEEMSKTMAAKGLTVDNDLTFSTMSKILSATKAAQAELWETIFPFAKSGMSVEEHAAMKAKVSNLYSEFIGVDSIKPVPTSNVPTVMPTNLSSAVATEHPQWITWKQPFEKDEIGNFIIDPNTGKKMRANHVAEAARMVFYPEHNLFGHSDASLGHYAGASSLGVNYESMVSQAFHYKVADENAYYDLMGTSSARAQAKYIAAMGKFANMDAKQFSEVVLAADDLPGLEAAYRAMVKNGLTAKGDEFLTVKVKRDGVQVSNATPLTIGQVDNIIPSRGVAKTYAKVLDDFTKSKDLMGTILYDAHNRGYTSTISPGAKQMLSDWVSGPGKYLVNQGALLWSSAGGYAAMGQQPFQNMLMAVAKSTDPDITRARVPLAHRAAELVNDIYTSKESQALRNYFKQHADADGFIYLYRGAPVDATRKGTNLVDSFTTAQEKAASFGSRTGTNDLGLYRVRVENLLGAMRDIGQGYGGDVEILVLADNRLAEMVKDTKVVRSSGGDAGAFKPVSKLTPKAASTIPAPSFKTVAGAEEMDFAQLGDLIFEQKKAIINDLLTLHPGISPVTLAYKANMPVEDVVKYLGSGQAMEDIKGLRISKIIDEDTAKAQLKADLKPLYVTGNEQKNQLAVGAAALDAKTFKNINSMFIDNVLVGSDSAAVRSFAKDMIEVHGDAIKILEDQIAKANNHFAGMRFVTSFDQFTRDMEDVGPIVSILSKSIYKHSNDLTKQVVTPLTDTANALLKDPAAMLELNTAIALFHTLEDWRVFRDGKFWQRAQAIQADGTKKWVEEAVTIPGTKDVYEVKTPGVRKLLEQMQEQSTELKALTDTIRKVKGLPEMGDIGFWMPSFNPVGKAIAYVLNQATGETQLIWAHTPAKLEEKVKGVRAILSEMPDASQIRILDNKTEQAQWNLHHGRLDTIHMKQADIAMKKKGASGQFLVNDRMDTFAELAGGYEHYITNQFRQLTDMYLSQTMDTLDKMSALVQAPVKNNPFTEVQKAVLTPKDAAQSVKRTLLNLPNDAEYSGWKMANRTFEVGLSMGFNTIKTVFDNTFGRYKGKNGFDLNKATTEDYALMSAELERRGIYNPYKQFDTGAAEAFGLAKIEDHKDISKRLVYASNALAATVALRFMDLAQPLVNMMSLPVLTSMAIADKMPSTFMGVAKKTIEVPPTAIMYEGMRFLVSEKSKGLRDYWEKQGYHSPLVSEVTELMMHTRTLDKGLIPSVEKALDSNLVKWMSWGADKSEGLVRQVTMSTGYVLAKRLYPELDDIGATIFARNFMDRAVGNYSASQRPVMFQGTLGVAMGLFQTYMLSMAQNMYRHLELKNYKAIGKAMLAQSTIFGYGSMPGFDTVSNMIGEHFSDENVDLVTGTFRALPDPVANMVLYGLPSNLGPGFTTRGDLQPRPPAFLGNPDSIPAYSMYKQTFQMMNSLVSAAKADSPEMARSLAQALSLQSMSRPLARMSEFATGYSVTRQGTTVQGPDDVWTFTSLAARMLGTRPIEEVKLRDAIHLNSYYGAIDRDNRQALTNKLRTAIRNGTLDDADIAKFSEEYMRKGGTPTGWRSAYQEALKFTELSGKEGLAEKLRPNSPINFMINNLD